MHIDLLKAIPLELRDRLDEEFALLLQVKPVHIHTMWPRCWKIISFHTMDDLVAQGCKQYLSHHQCIISTLLFGLSVCPFYINAGPVVSRDVAARYLNSGIRAVLVNNDKLDLSWLLAKHRGLWENICRTYIKHFHEGAEFPPEIVEFAQVQIGSTKAVA